MKPFRTLVALCCLPALFTACGKNNGSATKKLLMDGKWQVASSVTTATYKGKDSVIDRMKAWEPCEKDDIIEFGKDGKATSDEGAHRCPTDAQVTKLKYALLNNDTRIALIDSDPDTLDLEVSATEMKLKKTTTNDSGAIFRFVETYRNIR